MNPDTKRIDVWMEESPSTAAIIKILIDRRIGLCSRPAGASVLLFLNEEHYSNRTARLHLLSRQSIVVLTDTEEGKTHLGEIPVHFMPLNKFLQWHHEQTHAPVQEVQSHPWWGAFRRFFSWKRAA